MNSWFGYFLKKSLARRLGRFFLSAAAVMLTVSVVTAFATVSTGARDTIGGQLRQYGANMIVTGAAGGAIDLATADGIRTLSTQVKGASFQVYGTAAVQGRFVEVIGGEPETWTGYRVAGRLPRRAAEAMVGANLRGLVQAGEGGSLRFDGQETPYTITGFFERGSDEDSAVLMPLRNAQELLGMSGVSAVLLNGDTRHLEEIEAAVARRFPGLQVKTLRQVAVAEERVLGKIELLLLIVSAVVLFSSVIALGSTMGATVIERMGEIGLMKSLGAARGDIRNFFVAEAALAGLAGSAAGCLIGVAAAEAVAWTAFGSWIPVHPAVLPGSAVLGVLVAVLSTYFPVRDAEQADPAAILRGE